MRNIIDSYIHASSLRSEIRKLKKDALPVDRHQLFSFEQLIPTPLSLLLMSEFVRDRIDPVVRHRLIAETGFDNQSDWRGHQWGVSTDIANVIERKNDANYWMLKCTSVGNPPATAIQKLSERYPQIDFTLRYFGVNSLVAGDVHYRGGHAVRENRYEATTYVNLISRLQSKGVSICNEAGRLIVKYNPNLKAFTPTDDFSCIFGVTFDKPYSGGDSFFAEFE